MIFLQFMLSAKAIHAVQKRRLLYPSSPHAAHHDEAQHQSKSNISKDVQKNSLEPLENYSLRQQFDKQYGLAPIYIAQLDLMIGNLPKEN